MKKLILFDIDGTLISGRGVPKKVAIDVIHKFFPGFKNGNEVGFSGMTDPLIVQKVLQANGHHIEMDDPLVREILDEFMIELAKHVTPENPPLVLPGVQQLLNACREDKDIYMALVTGNMATGAKIKLSAAGLYAFFQTGAFGCDHWDRNKLPVIAVKRASEYFGYNFSAQDTWVIGDSIRDVECAHHNGMKCLAVTTGPTTREELQAHHPKAILPDLTDLDGVMDLMK